jgi:hypothetical protein
VALAFTNLTIPPARALNAVAQPRQLAAAGARALVPLTYGEDRVEALILNVLQSTTEIGKVLVQCLWGHAVHQVDLLRLNGQDLPAGTTVTTYTGTQVTADAALVASFALEGYTYTDTLQGYAYSVVALPVAAFDGQLGFSARVQGRKVYDPRLDSTSGGSGPQRLADRTTWAYSANPALCTADWLASTLYGAGEPVLWSSVITTANANDSLVGSPAETHRIIGLTITTATPASTLKEALRAYAGCWLLPTAAGVKLLPDADAASVASYSHAAGQIAALEPLVLADLGNSPTAVEVVFTSSQLPVREDSAIATLPGAGTTLPWRLSTVRLPGIQRYSQAYREAVERLNKLTLGDLSTSLEVFDGGIAHEEGDIISVTHPVGLTAKLLRVTAVEMPGPGRWRLGVAEHDPAAYSGVVTTGPTYSNTGRELRGVAVAGVNLIDATWWRPGATMEWPEYVGAGAANAIVWATGPKGVQQAVWRATAATAGGVNGGWEQGSLAAHPKNAFVVDVRKSYRFALPTFLTASHSGQWEWGPNFGGKVCTLNTTTPVADPRFWAAGVAAGMKGRWCLLVGYVFPAGSTGLTNAGAGVYDMETGALLSAGTSFCWAAATQECGLRAFYTAAGAIGQVNYWAQPSVEVFDGADIGRITYIGGLSVGTNQLASNSVTEGTLYDVSTATGSTGSPGASVRVVTMWGPTITTVAGDELDFVVSGVLDETFWSQCAVAHVELWLTHAPTFGGTQTEFGTRRRYMAPVDVYTATTPIVLDMTGQLAPGAVTQDYVLRVSITYRDAAGAAKQCGKDFSADAQWRVVRRKR